jgi:hypothetical protein
MVVAAALHSHAAALQDWDAQEMLVEKYIDQKIADQLPPVHLIQPLRDVIYRQMQKLAEASNSRRFARTLCRTVEKYTVSVRSAVAYLDAIPDGTLSSFEMTRADMLFSASVIHRALATVTTGSTSLPKPLDKADTASIVKTLTGALSEMGQGIYARYGVVVDALQTIAFVGCPNWQLLMQVLTAFVRTYGKRAAFGLPRHLEKHLWRRFERRQMHQLFWLPSGSQTVP